MGPRLSRRTFLAAAGTLAAGGRSAWADHDVHDYRPTTAGVGGTYYPVGVALATLVKVRLQPTTGINLTALESAGSGENVTRLRDGDAEFAILQGLFGHRAWTGSGEMSEVGPQQHLRSITMLWPNVEHFVMRDTDASTGTIADFAALKGRKVSLGKPRSGTIASNHALLGNLGLDVDADFELVSLSYNASADALAAGEIDGMSTPAGAPVAAVTRAIRALGDDIVVLRFTPEQAAAADGGLALWTPFVVPAGTYPGQDADLETIAQPNVLVTRNDIDPDAVYRIVRTIYENLPFLRAIHGVTGAMALEHAVKGLPLPLHPGARRFYDEQGVRVPDRLILP